MAMVTTARATSDAKRMRKANCHLMPMRIFGKRGRPQAGEATLYGLIDVWEESGYCEGSWIRAASIG